MQELLLFGQVPSSRHEIVLSVLAGIAAMQPQYVLEKHIVFKPTRPPASARAGPAGANQGVLATQSHTMQVLGDIFYLQLVADIDARTGTEAGPANVVMEGQGAAKDGVSPFLPVKTNIYKNEHLMNFLFL